MLSFNKYELHYYLDTMSGGSLSQECVEGRHTQCSIQIPYMGGPQTTNCQCQCHTSIAQTLVGETKSVEDKKVL
jgi:hypothetical protein